MAAYPPRWGQHLWPLLHLTARRVDAMTQFDFKKLTSKDSTKDTISFHRAREVLCEYLSNLEHHLPCEACAVNYRAFLAVDPVPSHELKADTEPVANLFFHWSVRAHNHANRVTGKREVTNEEAEAIFQKTWMDADVNQELSHAQKIRMEDHAKMNQLEADLAALRAEPKTNPVNVGLIIATLSVLVLATLIILWLLKRTK